MRNRNFLQKSFFGLILQFPFLLTNGFLQFFSLLKKELLLFLSFTVFSRTCCFDFWNRDFLQRRFVKNLFTFYCGCQCDGLFASRTRNSLSNSFRWIFNPLTTMRTFTFLEFIH